MSWTIRYAREAERDIDALDPQVRHRILLAIGNLAGDPRLASNVRALKGANGYRLRVGDWRVIYTLHDDSLVVLIVRVAHRREAYR